MRFEQEKMIVGSLPSLYPLQKFEEEAINALVSLPIDDDTISRAKAIEALTEYGNGQTLYISVEEATRRIKQLSPAHGTNLAEVGTDCISREQAIEALDKRFDSIPMEQTSEILMLRKDLRELPPAQPEIIRCKDCKHWIPYDWMFSEVWQSKNIADYPEDEIGCNYCDMAMKANDFCSRGERRTDG